MAGRKITIRNARKAAGLSARQLGNIIGCNEETIYKYEKMDNPNMLKKSVKLNLCNALNVPYEKLFYINFEPIVDIRPGDSKLKIARKKAGMTPVELANHLGITRQSLYNYESKRTAPPMNMAIKICKIFNCTLDELFWDDWNDVWCE